MARSVRFFLSFVVISNDLNLSVTFMIAMIPCCSYMKRKWKGCKLLKRPLNSFWTIPLKRLQTSSRKLRNNMIVGDPSVYLSRFYYRICLYCLLSSLPANSFSELPPGSKLHNLLSMAAKDVEIAPSPQDTGSHLILQHQKLMLDHFGHKHHAVLPEDVIQRLLLGVRTQFQITYWNSLLLCPLAVTLSFVSFLVFQNARASPPSGV